MVEMKKHLIYILLLTILLPAVALALEVDFPEVGGLKPGKSFGPGHWVKYIFVFGLAVVGLAIIYALTRAGFLWMTAGDNSGKISEAKDWIKGSVIGLVILVGSYTFLNTINPQLVSIRNPRIQIDVRDTWLKGFSAGWNKLYNPEERGAAPIGSACTGEEGCAGSPFCLKSDGRPARGTEQGTCTKLLPVAGQCETNNECFSSVCTKQNTDDKWGRCAEKPTEPTAPSDQPPNTTTAETGSTPAPTEWPLGFKAGDAFFVDQSKFANPENPENGLRMRTAAAGSVIKKFGYDTRGTIIRFDRQKDLNGVNFYWFEVDIGGQKGFVAGEFITKFEE